MRDDPYTILERKQRRQQLDYMMLRLPARYERFLRLHIGGFHGAGMTTKEIAESAGLSPARIYQMKWRSISRLQYYLGVRKEYRPPEPVYQPPKEMWPLPEPPPRPYDDMPHDDFLAELDDKRIMPPGYRVLTAFWKQWGLKMGSRKDDWLYEALRKWQHELSGQLERALREAYEAGAGEGEGEVGEGEVGEEEEELGTVGAEGSDWEEEEEDVTNVHLTAENVEAEGELEDQREQEKSEEDNGNGGRADHAA